MECYTRYTLAVQQLRLYTTYKVSFQVTTILNAKLLLRNWVHRSIQPTSCLIPWKCLQPTPTPTPTPTPENEKWQQAFEMPCIQTPAPKKMLSLMWNANFFPPTGLAVGYRWAISWLHATSFGKASEFEWEARLKFQWRKFPVAEVNSIQLPFDCENVTRNSGVEKQWSFVYFACIARVGTG